MKVNSKINFIGTYTTMQIAITHTDTFDSSWNQEQWATAAWTNSRSKPAGELTFLVVVETGAHHMQKACVFML